MQNEFFEKLLNILLKTFNNLEPISFWKNYEFWISSASIILLAITLYFLVRYTRATEKMVEYQSMPTVDVNMIYEKSVKRTYFWFLNASSIPAFVLIEFRINKAGKEKRGKIGPLRISPYHPNHPQFKKTATSFDFLNENYSRDTEVILNITVTSAFDNSHIKFEFTKSYKFDKSDLRWNENSWGYPDPPFPISKIL